MFCFSKRSNKTSTVNHDIPPELINKDWFSHWSETKSNLANFKSSSQLPKSAHTIIIGSGFTGVSLAYHLKKLRASNDIIIIEAREVCSGASGRNGGHLAPDYLALETIGHSYATAEQITHMAQFERLNFDKIYELIKETNIECGIISENARGFFLFKDIEQVNAAKLKMKLIGDQGFDLHDVILYDTPEDVENIVGVKGFNGALAIKSSPVNPYQLVTGLLEPLIESGQVKLYTNTPIDDISLNETEKNHFKFKLTTSKGDIISAQHVILATNAYSATFLDKTTLPKSSVYPVRGQVSRWVLKPSQLSHIPLVENKISIAISDEYFSVIPEKSSNGEINLSVVLGGARMDSPIHEINIIDDNKLEPIISRSLRKYMKDVFEIDQEPEEQWTGIMGFTKDPKPLVGQLPGPMPLLAVVGFMGHGMPRIHLSCEALVRRYFTDEKWPSWFPEYYRIEN